MHGVRRLVLIATIAFTGIAGVAGAATILKAPYHDFVSRPTAIYYCPTACEYTSDINWSSWGGANAYGHGVTHVPTGPGTYDSFHVSLHAYRIHDGHYTRLQMGGQWHQLERLHNLGHGNYIWGR